MNKPHTDAPAEILSAEKAALRRAMRARREAISPEEARAAGEAALPLLIRTACWRDAKVVMGYAAVRGELDVFPLMEAAWAEGKTVLFPRCESRSLSALAVSDRASLVSGMHGIPEPDGACPPVSPGAIDLVLVPGLAFDRAGGRLGQGAGYYDRFLAGTRALRVGVGYAWQVQDRVPTAPWDQPLDALLTPEEIVLRRQP